MLGLSRGILNPVVMGWAYFDADDHGTRYFGDSVANALPMAAIANGGLLVRSQVVSGY